MEGKMADTNQAADYSEPVEQTKDASPLPMTQAQIEAATIGAPALLDRPILIADYDHEWPQLFQREAARIRSVLGPRALAIEHVGSTSVPGLAAKPIIDTLLVVANSADEAAYIPALEATGYVLRIREPDWNEHRMLKGPDTDVNLHVFSRGCAEIERMLLFRDWLRRNREDLRLYEQTKLDLARRSWKYMQNYADAKSEIVTQILARAQKAAKSNRDETKDSKV